MNRGELEGKLWELCNVQRGLTVHIIKKLDGRPDEKEGIDRHMTKRRELVGEIVDWLEEYAVTKALDEGADAKARAKHYLAQFWKVKGERDEARRWAKLWKRAAKRKRAEAESWSQMFRQRYEKILEARAECTRLADQLDGSPWAGVLEQRDEARAECTELYECWQKAIERLCERVRAIERLCERLGYS